MGRTLAILALGSLLCSVACVNDKGDDDDDDDDDTDDGGSGSVALDSALSDLVSGLDDASEDQDDLSFGEAMCEEEVWSVRVGDWGDWTEEVHVAAWDLPAEHVGAPWPLERNTEGDWVGTIDAADLGVGCDQRLSSAIYFLPIAGDALGAHVATMHGAIDGTGWGHGGGTYDLEIDTETTAGVDTAQAWALNPLNGESWGPTEMTAREDGDWQLWSTEFSPGFVGAGDIGALLLGFYATSEGEAAGASGY
jgi:hypothetical protein